MNYNNDDLVNYSKFSKEREIRSLLKSSKELKCKDLIIITEEYEGENLEKWFGIKGKIKYIPLWKWLLENK
jgi:predicted AAA+ superfamily ATPase